jgi:hypothetical protein
MPVYRVVMDVTLRGSVLVEADSPDDARQRVEGGEAVPGTWTSPDTPRSPGWELEDWSVVSAWDDRETPGSG